MKHAFAPCFPESLAAVGGLSELTESGVQYVHLFFKGYGSDY